MLELVEKYSLLFSANNTVVDVSEYIITNEPNLTAVKKAELVVNIFATYGKTVKTTAACINWYKDKMKKKGINNSIKIVFKNHLNTIDENKKNSILLDLALKYQDILITQLTPEDMEIPEELTYSI